MPETVLTYLGNKRKLVPQILEQVEVVKNVLGKDKLKVADVFAGSTAVSQALLPHCDYLVAVDNNPCFKVVADRFLRTDNKRKNIQPILAKASFGGIKFDHDEPTRIKEGWFRQHYAPKDENNITKDDRCFYTVENAQTIDTYKQAVLDFCRKTYCTKEASEYVYNYFMAPLIIQASIHSNTCGIFKGFYKDKQGVGKFGGEGENALERIKGKFNLNYGFGDDEAVEKSALDVHTRAVMEDANKYFEFHYSGWKFDLAYLDPPYNQHPYGSNYFMLNMIADREESYKNLTVSDFSKVSGIPKDWERSLWNKRGSQGALLRHLLDTIPARYFLLSYSSTGFLSMEQLEKLLRGYEYKITELDYIQFRGSRNFNQDKKNLTEYLILIKNHVS